MHWNVFEHNVTYYSSIADVITPNENTTTFSSDTSANTIITSTKDCIRIFIENEELFQLQLWNQSWFYLYIDQFVIWTEKF